MMQANNQPGAAERRDATTLVVAEDEVLLRMALSEYLRDAGFHVLEAANGDEARKIVGAVGGVDLVISDVHMETKEEGIALARWLSEHYPEIPVILTSGSRDAASSPALAALKGVTFVPKPYSERQMERLARGQLAARDTSSK